MEHVQPLDRSFSWRAAALAVGLVLVIALAAIGGYVLIDRIGQSHAAPAASSHVTKNPPAVPLRPRSRISVVVLNGNGVNNAAGNEASRLLAAGYAHAVGADAQGRYAVSLVLFRPGWEGEAQRLARDAHIRVVRPLDGHLPAADASDQLIFILGAR